MNEIEEKKKKGFQFLHRLYEMSGGDTSQRFDSLPIGEELGFDKGSTVDIVRYLSKEGLIVPRSIGGIAITHAGIREVEETSS